MTKTQTIFLDRTPYNIQSGSLIDPCTEILNVIIDDGTPQTECQLIGSKMEYKPLVWLKFENENIYKLEELNFIFLGLKASDKLKKNITNLFPALMINFYELLHYGNYWFFELAKKYGLITHTARHNNCYFSIGKPRLQRFYLAWFCQRVGMNNFGLPKLGQELIKSYLYQLTQISCKKIDINKFYDREKRFFGNINQSEFEAKQMSLLADTRINIVSHQFYFDYITHHYDEKTALPIASKTLPFFFDNKGTNRNLKDMGFEPYVGFDYSAEHMDNFVERWETVLQNNKKFFLEEKESKEIYDMNKNIIDNNYRVLMETNWREKALAEFLQLPGHIRDAVENNTNLI